MFQCVDKLLASTHFKPREVDFLIVNCSLYCPTPSLSQSVARRYAMRTDVRTYNIGGMVRVCVCVGAGRGRAEMGHSPATCALV